MTKRIFDIVFSLAGLVVLSPVFIIIALVIKSDSKGPVFFIQSRVGRNNRDFRLLKFRTMKTDSDRSGLLTVGDRDPRITSSGIFLRKYKLDELPQLFNVLKGEMSFVGPRPEVRKYVDLYNEDQMKVLLVKPGITDLASIKYRNENELLSSTEDPEGMYTKEIMPDKIKINSGYISDRSLLKDIKIILKTLKAVIS
ncbi:MAG: sugar transferase [Bacteroidetes bacterium]|nr:sugar transferase [Bacteroidota bacterium]